MPYISAPFKNALQHKFLHVMVIILLCNNKDTVTINHSKSISNTRGYEKELLYCYGKFYNLIRIKVTTTMKV